MENEPNISNNPELTPPHKSVGLPAQAGHWHLTPAQKGILVFGVVGVVIMLSFYIYAVYLAKVAYNKVTLEAQKAQEKVLALQQERQTNVPSDWKTYTNTQYGFEFKYPGDWVLNEESVTDAECSSQDVDPCEINKALSFSVFIENKFIGFDISIYKISKDNYISAVNDQLSGWLNVLPASSGFTLLKERDYEAGPGAIDRGWSRWIVGNDEYTYKIDEWLVGGVAKSFDDYPFDINQFLSTFKFINITDTSAWKTYRNEEENYELKYPEGWSVLSAGTLYGPQADLSSIVISRFENISDLNSDLSTAYSSYRQYLDDTNRFKSLKPYFLGGIRAFKALSASGNPVYNEILFENNGQLYEITYYPRYEQTLSQLNQILSTFKFIK